MTMPVLTVVIAALALPAAASPQAYGALYQLGRDAYLEEDYQSCVNLLLQALQSHRDFEETVFNCRTNCRRLAAAEQLSNEAHEQLPTGVHDELLSGKYERLQLAAFERLINETRCLVQCQKRQFNDRLPQYLESAWADEDFTNRKPYEYLQLCFYKVGQPQKAADAVFTVLLHNPNHEAMQENLRYYIAMDGVDGDRITSLVRQEHNELYARGNSAYESGQYAITSQLMEDALDSYLEAEQRCRMLCERFFPQGYNPDFISNVANHFTYVLRCKLRCPDQLSTVAGSHVQDYFVSHFHYLQFAYYKQNLFREACRSLASYLLFKPEDAAMLNNKRHYLSRKDVDESFFVPRLEASKIFQRMELETKLDKSIIESFQFGDA